MAEKNIAPENRMDEDDRVNPLVITFKDTGERLELDFCRESVKFSEQRGFSLENVDRYVMTGVEDLFYYALRKNHRNIPRDKADKLLLRMHGLTPTMITRLVLLYQQAITSNVIQMEEDLEKNENLAVEM